MWRCLCTGNCVLVDDESAGGDDIGGSGDELDGVRNESWPMLWG